MPRFLALTALLVGCGASEPLTFATYNVGLAEGFVAATAERTPLISEAVAGLDADVICVQEYFLPKHEEALLEVAREAFPHHVFANAWPETLPEPACAFEDIEEIKDCFEANCLEVCPDDVADCLMSSCALPFLRLDKTCMGCVQANVGLDIDHVVDTCTTENTQYVYEGGVGVGILSRHPILSSGERVLQSTTTRRAVVHALIDAPGGEVDVYCTHLTAVFRLIPYPREEGSWSEEQIGQINEMFAFMDEVGTADRVVLAGDLNTGPATLHAEEREPESWALVSSRGLDAPYVQLDGRCTFCPENPLNTATVGNLIDHVLLGGFEGEYAASRILDQEITVMNCDGEIPAALSDHYGAKVTVTP